MNEHREPDPVPPPIPAEALNPYLLIEPPATRRWSYWAKRLLLCNPFYLASAALLLYGIYRVSADTSFLTKELSQLIFNFSSLQLYELLLVATAILLARRRIWYDSTLLIALENLLVIVPFILVTQGAVIDPRYIWVMCSLAGLVALLRFGAAKHFFREINLPKGFLAAGTLLLLLNVVLPILYRHAHEVNRAGSNPDFGPQFNLSRITWLLILPAAFALGNFLPHAKEKGQLLPQRRWLPPFFFTLWLLATVVHVYSMDYVYQLAIHPDWLAPLVWVAAWTAYRRAFDLFALPQKVLKSLLFVSCAFTPLFAVSQLGHGTFLTLAALNAGMFAVIGVAQRENGLSRHLFFASALLLILGLPENLLLHYFHGLDRENFAALGIMAYLLLLVVLSRNPKLGILGACGLGFAVALVLNRGNNTAHWAIQSGLVFLLLHSLRWEDERQPGAGVARTLAGILWMAHSFVWVRADATWWTTCIPGALVLGGYLTAQFVRGRWDRFTILISATFSMLSSPGNALANKVSSAPGGLLAVIGSFLLFAIGTALALTKHRWHEANSGHLPD